MLNSPVKTSKIKFDSCVIAVKLIPKSIVKTSWLNLIQRCWNQTGIWSEIQENSWQLRNKHCIHLGSLLKKLPIDMDFIHFIFQFHQFCGIKAREFFRPAMHTLAHRRDAGRFEYLMTTKTVTMLRAKYLQWGKYPFILCSQYYVYR